MNGRSQPLRAGELVAYDEREGLGWIVGRFVVDDVTLERAIVVAPDYLIDELRWSASRDVRVELPLHIDAISIARTEPAILDGGQGLEDGFSFARDVYAYDVPAGLGRWMLGLVSPEVPQFLAYLSGTQSAAAFTAFAPGQPPSTTRRFVLLRSEAKAGLFRSVHAWSGAVHGLGGDGDGFSIRCRDGEQHNHRRDEGGWHVEFLAGGARSSVDLAGFRARTTALEASKPVPSRATPLQRSRPLSIELGEQHYRRSEESWRAAGCPRATISIEVADDHLVIIANIQAGDPVFAPADAMNPFDNEQADTMRAGVQLFIRDKDASGGLDARS